MPELRRDPIRNQWVIIAPERAKRPSDGKSSLFAAPSPKIPEDCPFCPGNENMTPPAAAEALDAEGSWRVRVIPNKFPALQAYDDLERAVVHGMFDRMNGVGDHEVIIETPDHNKELPDLDIDQLKVVVDMYVQRLRQLMSRPSSRYVLLFKNHGSEAGASLLHPHSQIVATPIVPTEVRTQLNTAKTYYDRTKRCLFCDVMLAELEATHRIVDDKHGFVVRAPYASRFPFELRIVPRQHQHDFTMISDKDRYGLALTLKQTLTRLRTLLGDVPYNFVLQTAPHPIPRPGKPGYWTTLSYDYHWRLEILPRLTTIAGFEWGTGLYINPVPPERAAESLRGISVGEA